MRTVARLENEISESCFEESCFESWTMRADFGVSFRLAGYCEESARERETSLLTTYWSESTLSSW